MKKIKISIFIALFIPIAIAFGMDAIFAEDISEAGAIELSLDNVIALAVKNNIDVKIAKYDALISSTDIDRERSVFDTVLSVDADYSVDKLMRSSTISGSKEVVTDYNAGLTKMIPSGTTLGLDFTNVRSKSDSAFAALNPSYEPKVEFSLVQELARNAFGIIDRGNVTAAQLEYAGASFTSLEHIEDAIGEAEKRYWDLVFASDEKALRQDALKAAEDLYDINKGRLDKGLVEDVELVASEANLAKRRTDLIIAQNNIDRAVNALKLAINDSSDLYIMPADMLKLSGGNISFDEALKTAVKNRRDYNIARTAVKERDLKVKMRSNARWPQIDMDATFAVNGIDKKYVDSLNKISTDKYEYGVGFAFSYPLENREAASRHSRAVFEKAKALLELEKAERRIVREIDDAVKRVKVYGIKADEYNKISGLQEMKLGEERKRFNYGRSDSDTVIRFQDDLIEARISAKAALLEYNYALIDMKLTEDTLLGELGVDKL